ncbi:MAG TPA: ribonuclease J, partial [Ktedonobacterales bacterium]
LREHRQHELAQLHSVQPEDTVDVGPFQVRFLRVNHSIPDAMALAVTTPAGVIVHTGDYKFDYTPVDERRTELGAFARLGDEGVLVLCGDSTRVESQGHTPSERQLGETFDDIIAHAPGRVIVATFASLISRVQQVANSAARHGRQVALVGRSMVNNAQMAIELGYLKVPDGLIIPVEHINNVAPDKLVLICTGSQGEPNSALTRIANADHRFVQIKSRDTVILSSTPIVGNEMAVSRNIDNLMRQGANVLYSAIAKVHVSGHGSREELKLMLALVRPRYVLPVHGEYRMLAHHAKLAEEMGVPRENSVVARDGDVIEASMDGGISVVSTVPCGNVYVDGLGVGDVGQAVLRDRRVLSNEGVLVVVLTMDSETGQMLDQPDMISRGFVYERESESLIEAARTLVAQTVNRLTQGQGRSDWNYIKNRVRDTLAEYLYSKTRRRPMILPMIVDV